MEKLKENVFGFLAGRGADSTAPAVAGALSRLANRAEEHLNACTPMGKWEDLEYGEEPSTDWPVRKHYQRVYRLAQAYQTPGQRLYQQDKVLKVLNRAIGLANKVVYPGCPRPGNWWQWDIGIPKSLAPTLLLLEGVIDEKTFIKSLQTIAFLIRSDPKGTGQNLVWESINHFFYGLLTKDATRINKMQTNIARLCTISSSEEGIMPDYSFHQHGAQLYTGGYGSGFAEEVARFIFWTNKTPWQINKKSQQIFFNYLDEGISWSIFHQYYDPAVISREITRREKNARGGLRALIIAASVANQKKSYFRKVAKRVLDDYLGSFDVALANLVSKIKASAALGMLPKGYKYYPWSDHVIQRGVDYYISVKMLSQRMRSAELINKEGLKSWHLSDGMTYVVNEGDEYFSQGAWATMDWSRLPGITVEQKERLPGKYEKGSRAFVGSAHTPTYGVAAMDFKAIGSDLSAKKSWFFFEGALVCLGSGITCPSNNPVETIVNQWPMSAWDVPLYIDGKRIMENAIPSDSTKKIRWIQCDDMGYFFPDSAALNIRKEKRIGKWIEINGYGSADSVINPMLTIWYAHGIKPAGKSYHYIILPGKSKSATKAFARSKKINLIANNNVLHAVAHNKLKAAGAVFWQAGEIDKFKVSDPCAIFFQYYADNSLDFALTNPNHDVKEIIVEVAGILKKPTLPKGVSLKGRGEKTILTFATEAGKNYYCHFQQIK